MVAEVPGHPHADYRAVDSKPQRRIVAHPHHAHRTPLFSARESRSFSGQSFRDGFLSSLSTVDQTRLTTVTSQYNCEAGKIPEGGSRWEGGKAGGTNHRTRFSTQAD